MDIKIKSLEDALRLIENHWPTKVISLIPEDMPDHGIESLHLRFDDISRPIGGYIHPTKEDLDRILEFADSLDDDDRLLIHCHAGISRSTSAAIAVLMQRGWTYQEAFNHISIIRPILSPNRLIIRYLDEYFDLNGKLIELVLDNERYPHLIELAEEE